LLTRIADDSGGRAFFPKELSEVSSIVGQIAKDLRSQYKVRYYPSNEKRDGTYRKIRVEANSPQYRKLIARTRAGYYATTDGPTEEKSERNDKKEVVAPAKP